MRQIVAKHQFFSPLFAAIFLVLATTIVASSFTAAIQSQPSKTQRDSRQMESEVAQWSERLRSGNEEERREAAMELSNLKSSGAVSLLASLLNDGSPRVRAAAAAALAGQPEESSVPVLAACLAKEENAFVRKTAVYALGGFRGPERTAAVIASLKDRDLEVRGAAAVSLGDHPDASAIAALTIALSDKSAFVRARAARALGVNGSSAGSAVTNLIRLLASDEESEVKRQAAAALGLIGDRSALSALERARNSRDPYLVDAAIEAIRMIESKH